MLNHDGIIENTDAPWVSIYYSSECNNYSGAHT